MRGRLINPFVVEIAQLNAQLSDATSPGTNPVFKEPNVGIDPTTNQRTSGRKDKTIFLPAQIEDGTYGQLVVLANGIAPKTQLKIIFHYEDFEELGMVDDRRRNVPIRITDRLVAIYSAEDRDLLVLFPNPPGVWITEATPTGFMGGRVNLLVCTLGSRDQGKPAGGV